MEGVTGFGRIDSDAAKEYFNSFAEDGYSEILYTNDNNVYFGVKEPKYDYEKNSLGLSSDYLRLKDYDPEEITDFSEYKIDPEVTTKNGYPSEYLTYGQIGNNNRTKSQEFADSVTAINKDIAALESYLNAEGQYVWESADSKAKAVALIEELKTEGSEVANAVELLKGVTAKADLMSDLSKELNNEQILQQEFMKLRMAAEEELVRVRALEPKPAYEIVKKEIMIKGEPHNVEYPKEKDDHVQWRAAVKDLENERDENKTKETEHQEIAKEIADKIKKYEAAINYLNDRVSAIAKPKKKYDPGNDDPGGGGGPRKEIKYVDTTQEQMKYYQEMDTSLLISLSSLLKSLADSKGVSLSEFLTNSKYAAMIRENLLKDSNLSQELRKALQNGDPSKTQALLKSIVFVETDEARAMFGFDRTTVTPIADLIKISANSNDISEYIKNGGNVKKALSDIGSTSSYIGALNSNNVIDELMNVYNGDVNDDFSDTSFVVVRSFLDEVSEYRDTPVDNILSSNDYIQEPLVNLYKTTSYLSNISSYSDEDASLIITNMLNNGY